MDPDGINSLGGKCDISLLCNTCSEAFETPWDLMVHAQAAHSMHIYEYKNDDGDDESKVPETTSEETLLVTMNENAVVPINNYNVGVPHLQSTEQSFLPRSQPGIVGNRAH